MVATRARRASGEGTPKQTATKRVAARSKSPAPKKPAARAKSPAPRGKKPSSKKGQRKPPPPVGLYDRALATYPVATNAAQAGLMSFASALASQSLAGIPLDELDYEKPLHFGAVAALVVAPLSLVFFNFVENLSVPAKLLFDLVVGGPVLNVGFVAALGLLGGSRWSRSSRRCRRWTSSGSRSCSRRTRSGCRRRCSCTGSCRRGTGASGARSCPSSGASSSR